MQDLLDYASFCLVKQERRLKVPLAFDTNHFGAQILLDVEVGWLIPKVRRLVPPAQTYRF